MGQTLTPKPTDSDNQRSSSHGAGAPVQRSFRGVIRETYEEEGQHILHALAADLESTGLPDAEIADRTGVEKAQLSRIRAGQAHPPARLLAWAIEQSRHVPARILVAVCSAGEGTFTPKPPPDPAEWFEAYREVLAEMDILDRVHAKAARRLGVQP